MKINFTQEHYARMKELAFGMLIANEVVVTRFGSPLNICELMHTQSINSLNAIRLSIQKQIESIEAQDEWIATEEQQEQLSSLREKKELVNLIVGWKRSNLELKANMAERAKIAAQIAELREAQRTPEDKLKDLESRLKELDTDVETLS